MQVSTAHLTDTLYCAYMELHVRPTQQKTSISRPSIDNWKQRNRITHAPKKAKKYFKKLRQHKTTKAWFRRLLRHQPGNGASWFLQPWSLARAAYGVDRGDERITTGTNNVMISKQNNVKDTCRPGICGDNLPNTLLWRDVCSELPSCGIYKLIWTQKNKQLNVRKQLN